MTITEISKEAFDSLNVGEQCRSLWSAKLECGWFIDRTANVVCVLHFDDSSELFGYSVCVRAEDGRFRRATLGADIPRESMARRELLNAMHDFDGAPLAPDRPR